MPAGDEDVAELICTHQTFRPVQHDRVRWLDQVGDLELYGEAFYRSIGEDPPSQDEWEEWIRDGYHFCGLVLDGRIVARAAVWAYSDSDWELAAVLTRPEHRGHGYGRSICSFATAHILAGGREATCHTGIANAAMLRIAERLGYRRRSTARWTRRASSGKDT